MEHIDWQLQRFGEGADRAAIIWRDRACDYSELTDRYRQWLGRLEAAGVRPGDSVGVLSDFSPGAVSCLLALLKMRWRPSAITSLWRSREASRRRKPSRPWSFLGGLTVGGGRGEVKGCLNASDRVTSHALSRLARIRTRALGETRRRCR